MANFHMNYTILISINDLESAAISELIAADEASCIIDLGLEQGDVATLDIVRDKIEQTYENPDPNHIGHIIAIELSMADGVEHYLSQISSRFSDIDHHFTSIAGNVRDMTNTLSSIEQLLLLRPELWKNVRAVEGKYEKFDFIAANDRDYWNGLLSSGASLDKSLNVRALDHEAKTGLKHDEILKHIDEAKKFLTCELKKRSGSHDGLKTSWIQAKAKSDKLLLVETDLNKTPHNFTQFIPDAAFALCFDEDAGKPIPLDYIRVSVFFPSDSKQGKTAGDLDNAADEKTPEVFYSTAGRGIDFIRHIIKRENSRNKRYSRLSLYCGGGERSAFLGATAATKGPNPFVESQLRALTEEILRETQIDLMPVQRWRSRFIQFLDGAKAAENTTPRITSAVQSRFFPGLLETESDPLQDQDRNYLMPYLRDYLAPGRSPTPTMKKAEDGSVGGEATDAETHNNETKPPIPPRKIIDFERHIPFSSEAHLSPESLTVRTYTADLGHPDFANISARLVDIDATHVSNGRLTKDAESKLNKGEFDRNTPVKLSSLCVHFLYNNLIAIDWAYEGGAVFEEDHKIKSLWELAFERQENQTLRHAADVLNFNEIARKAYVDYNNPEEKSKQLVQTIGDMTFLHDQTVGPRSADAAPTHFLGELVARAIGPFFGETFTPEETSDGRKRKHEFTKEFDRLFDARSRGIVSLVLSGQQPQTGTGQAALEVLRARFAGLDNWERNFFYDPDFTRQELARLNYGRFDKDATGHGTYWTVSDHAITMLGFGWFPKMYGYKHLDRMYRRLFMLVLEYSAIITTLSFKLGYQSTPLKDAPGPQRHTPQHQTNELRKRFTTFANGLWFSRVSPQLQGQELFDKMVSELKIERDYQELQAELDRQDEIEAIEREHQQKGREAMIAGIVSALSLFIAVLGLLAATRAEAIPITDKSMWVGIIVTAIVALLFGFFSHRYWKGSNR